MSRRSLPLPLAVAGERVTSPDLLRMHQGGLRDATILAFIQTYRAALVLAETDWASLSQAGLGSTTIQTLRAYALAQPALPSEETQNHDSKPPRKALLSRFFVGYPHDPAAFPAWYDGSVSSVTRPEGHALGWVNPRVRPWREDARSPCFHGRRL